MEHDLVEEGAWAAIVIQQGVTHALDLARSIGNANYNGSQAISVYYAQARQESALGSYLVPLMQASLGQLTAQVSAQSAAQ